MNANRHLLRNVLIITLGVVVGGTAGYTLIEGWPVFDALYMTIITLTTIGYGEVHELSAQGRIFTVVLVMFGLGAAAAFAAQFARLFIEGELGEYWRKRRMERMLNRLKGHVIVCGYGRIGQAICSELREMGATVAVVEMEEERLNAARDAGLPVMVGNATSDVSLLGAGVQRAEAVVAALSRDTDNVFVALSARDLNPDVRVIARAEDRALESRMLKAGVDRIVYPAQLGGGRIAHMVGEEIGLDSLKETRRSTDVMGYDLKTYRNLEDRTLTLHEVEFGTGSLRTIALVQADGARIDNPPATAMLHPMEVALLLVDTAAAAERRHRRKAVLEISFEDLSVGVETLDEEHQRLLTLYKRLCASDPVTNPGIVSELLAELHEFSFAHFSLEESIFRCTSYSEADEHAAEHAEILEKIKIMASEAADTHPDNLIRLLENWILEHIMKRDREMVPFVSRQPN